MKQVGDYLRANAIAQKREEDIDAFARSAFNRYYYAAYLKARELYRALYPPPAEVPGHKDFPGIFTRKIYKTFTAELTAAVASGLWNGGEAQSERRRVRTLTSSIHDLLKDGYRVRVTADYKPEQKATRSGDNIVLDEVTLHTAANWPQRAEKYCGGLLSTWRSLGK